MKVITKKYKNKDINVSGGKMRLMQIILQQWVPRSTPFLVGAIPLHFLAEEVEAMHLRNQNRINGLSCRLGHGESLTTALVRY